MSKLNKSLMGVCGALVIVALFFWAISPILLPFVLAFVLAYFLNPLSVRLQKYKLGTGASAGIVVGGFCVFVISLFLVLIPILQTQVLSFLVKVPNIVNILWDKIKVLISYTQNNISYEQMYQISDAVSQNALMVLNSIGNGLLSILSGGMVVFNVLALLVITPVVLFYVLKDFSGVSTHVKALVPERMRQEVLSLWGDINKTLSGFIRGQISVCLSLSVYYALGLSLVGLELGALVGILAGILSFIPYFGFLTGVLLSVLLALSQGAGWGIWIGLITVFVIGQVLEGYVLTPRLVGKSVGLHPVWIIFALMAGGVLMGFLGVLIAVPVAAVIGVFVRRFLVWYKSSKIYKGK